MQNQNSIDIVLIGSLVELYSMKKESTFKVVVGDHSAPEIENAVLGKQRGDVIHATHGTHEDFYIILHITKCIHYSKAKVESPDHDQNNNSMQSDDCHELNKLADHFLSENHKAVQENNGHIIQSKQSSLNNLSENSVALSKNNSSESNQNTNNHTKSAIINAQLRTLGPGKQLDHILIVGDEKEQNTRSDVYWIGRALPAAVMTAIRTERKARFWYKNMDCHT